MAVTFDEARQVVLDDWSDYRVADYGYEDDDHWFLILLPETIGGRIPAVAKSTGAVIWINENAEIYTQERPVGIVTPAVAALTTWHLPGEHNQKSHAGGSSSFDARAANALTGKAAHSSVRYRSGGNADIDSALEKYGGEGNASYFDVNRKLRDGGKMTPDQQHTQDGLDKAFADAKGAGSDMVVYRFMGSDMSVIFGGSPKDYWNDPPNLTGLSWRDKGFMSTSVHRGEAGGGVRMRILVPKGTKAISHRGLDPDEILLNRGRTLRVVKDHGRTPFADHDLDVEVVE